MPGNIGVRAGEPVGSCTWALTKPLRRSLLLMSRRAGFMTAGGCRHCSCGCLTTSPRSPAIGATTAVYAARPYAHIALSRPSCRGGTRVRADEQTRRLGASHAMRRQEQLKDRAAMAGECRAAEPGKTWRRTRRTASRRRSEASSGCAPSKASGSRLPSNAPSATL